jgi:hypothetical protein
MQGTLRRVDLSHLRGVRTQDDESVRWMGHTKDGHVDPKGHDDRCAHGFVWAIGSAKWHDDSIVHGFAKGHDTPKGRGGLR